MRPPVAAQDGQSPLRGERAAKVFKQAKRMKDPVGFKVTREQVVNNYTDDGKLADTRWNSRHTITPSFYNGTNHNFYKQFFDKNFKTTEDKRIRELSQQKTLDPFEEAEIRGTRMPEISKISHDRDIYGELGWVSNFQVKSAKDNTQVHHSYREFFDAPKAYHMKFTSSTMTNSEFFRKNAPNTSVAHERSKSTSFAHWRQDVGDGKRGKTSMNVTGSIYQTPFVLQEDKRNNYKVSKKLRGTTLPEMESMIPFLRDHKGSP